MAEITEHIRSMSVKSWHALALEGTDIPISIFLNGDSMGPLIRRNRDRVTLIPLRRPVKTGDIVLFADGDGRYVVHRVRKRRNEKILTIGDHCTAPDEPLQDSMIWGLVVRVQRDGRDIPLDNKIARGVGRLWMALLPLRKIYYGMKNRGNDHDTQ